LVKWNTLAKPKKDGGWGLKNIYLFGQALIAKSVWQTMFNEGLWGRNMKKKYFISYIVEQWIRTEPKYSMPEILLSLMSTIRGYYTCPR
jgi:hypothetical protein